MDIRLKESLRDIFLSSIEFVNTVSALDNTFSNYERSRAMINNKKYATLMSNILDDYGSRILNLNENTMRNIAKIQKKFVKKDQSSHFVEAICSKLKEINKDVQKVRDTPIVYSHSKNGGVLSRLQGIVDLYFPTTISLENDGKMWERTNLNREVRDSEGSSSSSRLLRYANRKSKGLSSYSEKDE